MNNLKNGFKENIEDGYFESVKDRILILSYSSLENYFLYPKILVEIGIVRSEDDFYEKIDNHIKRNEETIKKAVAFMIKQEKYIVEPGSATVTAAIMEHRERIGGKNIALVISGGNIDGDLMVEILNQ